MIPSSPKVLFIANAGPLIGGGHVMRCLTLAQALATRGAVCAFANTEDVGTLLDVFAPDMPREAASGLDSNALVDTVTAAKFDAIVFDHYGLGRGEHLSLADGKPCLVIDDLADRALGGDLVLDSGPARNLLDYTLLMDGKARLLLGPDYAPVRAEFADLRQDALARRDQPVRRLMITMGLSDPAGITERIVDLLRPRLSDVALDVVIGGQSASLRALTRIASRDSRLTVHVDATDMAQIMARADLLISAAGSTIWEGCTLGLPMILIVVADNQSAAAEALATRNAAIVLDGRGSVFDDSLSRAIVHVTADLKLRRQLGSAAAEICDGGGAGRVADAFFEVIAGHD